MDCRKKRSAYFYPPCRYLPFNKLRKSRKKIKQETIIHKIFEERNKNFQLGSVNIINNLAFPERRFQNKFRNIGIEVPALIKNVVQDIAPGYYISNGGTGPIGRMFPV